MQPNLFMLTDVTSEKEVVPRFLDLLNLFQLDLLVEEYSDQTKTFLIIHKNEKGLYQKAVSFLVSLMRTSPFWFSWDTIVREFRKREGEQAQNGDLLLSIGGEIFVEELFLLYMRQVINIVRRHFVPILPCFAESVCMTRTC